MKTYALIIAACLSFTTGLTHAQNSSAQPNGTVTIANLEWLRCSLGQTWTGSVCAGDATEFKWTATADAAKQFNTAGYDGKTDWRVPSITELASLRVCSTGFAPAMRELKGLADPVPFYCNDGHQTPTIDAKLFPNTQRNWYWSSNTVLADTNYAYFVDFRTSSLNSEAIRMNGHLRLVRAAK